MNNKHNQFMIDIINILLKFLVAFSIMAFLFLSATGEKEYVWKISSLLPAPFISYIISQRTKKLWTFLILHILLLCVYIIPVDDIALKVVFLAYLGVLTVMAYVQRVWDKFMVGNTHIGFVCFIVVVCIYCEYAGLTGMGRFLLALTFAYALLFLINHYLINFKDYFVRHEGMANIPIRQIATSNRMLITIFCVLCLGIMLLFLFFPATQILTSLGGLILMVVKVLVSLVHPGEESPTKEKLEEDKVPPNVPGRNLFLEILSNILYYSLMIVVFVLIIATILYILYRIYKRFYMAKPNEFKDQLEFISPFDHRSKGGRGRRPIRKMLTSIFGGTNNERIRKHYYSSIIKHTRKEQISKAMTPTQLSGLALNKAGEEVEQVSDTVRIEELTELYEKARYGREECSKEELGKVKELLK